MRQVTREVCGSFKDHKARTVGNSHTDGATLYLHGNAIAQWRDDGLYITNAGWPTVTTKERLNGLDGVRIHQEKGQWYLNGHKWDGEWIRVDTFKGNVSDDDTKAANKMLTRIKEYSKLYMDSSIYPLIPSGGDCWYCALHTDSGKPLGDATDNHAHLEMHLDDKYTHGSMALNALREAGYSDPSIGVHLHGMANNNVQRAVYRYMKKRLTKLAR